MPAKRSGSPQGAGINKAIKRRNEQLEMDIASIRKLYDDFTQKSDAFILKLTNERDEANKNLKALINRN